MVTYVAVFCSVYWSQEVLKEVRDKSQLF